MIKYINSNSLQEAKDLHGLIDQAQRSDFDGLELSLELTGPLGQVTWEDLRKEIGNSNLKIASLTSTQFDLFTLASLDGESERTAGLDTFKYLLYRAASCNFNPRVVISAHEIHALDQMIVDDYESAFNSLFVALTELADAAEKLSIPLAIENPGAGLLLSPLELRDFIDQINNPYVGLCLNPSHAARFGSPLDWLHILDQRIFAVHLNLSSISKANDQGKFANLLCALKSTNNEIPIIYK